MRFLGNDNHAAIDIVLADEVAFFACLAATDILVLAANIADSLRHPNLLHLCLLLGIFDLYCVGFVEYITRAIPPVAHKRFFLWHQYRFLTSPIRHSQNVFVPVILRRMSARAYRGASTFGAPILTIGNDGFVYEGTPVFGTPIMNISGDRIYKGSSTWGPPIATVKGEYVYEGVGGLLSAPLATIKGEYVYEGSSSFGAPIATVKGGGRVSAAATAVYLLLM